MDTSIIKAQVKRAWVLTWEIREVDELETRLEGILDASIPSLTMLKFVGYTCACRQLTAQEQMIYVDNQNLPFRASFVYLNDGSIDEDLVVCSAPGKATSLNACRAYDITIHTDSIGNERISWKEASLIVENGRREIFFWTDHSLFIVNR